MKDKKILIVTASDSKYGDFLINHWLTSLLDNINSKLVQIVVLDYGLTEEQRKILEGKKIIVKKCKRNGHVVNIRFRDILSILKNKGFEQIMSCDSGDMIFQSNIMSLFYKNSEEFRAVTEGSTPLTIEMSILKKCFSRVMSDKIIKNIDGRKTINGGLVIANRKNFIKLCDNMNKYILDKSSFGPDQAILNYLLYKEGFVNIGREYNYILGTVDDKFRVKKGVFYDSNNMIIPVIHNAGGKDYTRIVSNFGYGENYNKINYIKREIIRSMNRLSIFIKPLLNLLLKWSFR